MASLGAERFALQPIVPGLSKSSTVEVMVDGPCFQRNWLPLPRLPLSFADLMSGFYVGQPATFVRVLQTVSGSARISVSLSTITGAARSISISATLTGSLGAGG